jgi:hypothetical protein
MVGEPLHVPAQTLGMHVLDGRHDPGMQRPTSLLQQRAVRHVLRERVLERVLHGREQAHLVEELRRLQLGQALSEQVLRHVYDLLQQVERHIHADDGGGLEQPPCLDGQPVDARREHRLDGRRYLDALHLPAGAIRAALASERPRLLERTDALFEKERVAFGAIDQRLLEHPETGAVAEERLSSSSALAGGSGSIRNCVVAPAPPGVLVPGR